MLYTSFGGVSEAGLTHTFLQRSRDDAIAEWLAGDRAAMERAEARVRALVARWLAWFDCACAGARGAPPAVRMDFLVRRVAPGRARVHTLELTELGFSLLGWKEGPRVVLGAVLESCFDDTGATREEARLLRAHAEGGGDRADQLEAPPGAEQAQPRKRKRQKQGE